MKLHRSNEGAKVKLTFEVDLAELNRVGLLDEFLGIYENKRQHAKLYADFLSKAFKTPAKHDPLDPYRNQFTEAFRQKTRIFGSGYSESTGTFQGAYERARRILEDGPPPAGDPPWCKVLGLPKTATKDEIKFKYRQLAKTHHPDAGGNDTEFRKITQAYEEALK